MHIILCAKPQHTQIQSLNKIPCLHAVASRLHLLSDIMYDFPGKPSSSATLSRCRLLLKHKLHLGMQKTADGYDSSKKGGDLGLASDVFHCSDLLRLV